jgi:hypothetical protein
LVESLYQRFGKSAEIQNALSQRFYAPYALLMLIERDTFMKLEKEKFQFYEKCLATSTQEDLEEFSKSEENE